MSDDYRQGYDSVRREAEYRAGRKQAEKNQKQAASGRAMIVFAMLSVMSGCAAGTLQDVSFGECAAAAFWTMVVLVWAWGIIP